MPTIAKFGGLRVVIYTNDHRPAHVHVMDAGREAVFILNCPSGPCELRENYGFKSGELAKIALLLNSMLADACDEWSAIHDH